MAYVDEVVLQDVRAIAASRVPFVHPVAADSARLGTPNVNLVLGTNGSGKSSVLKAVAAVLLAARGDPPPESASGWPRIGGVGDAVVQLRLSAAADAPGFGHQLMLRIPRAGGAPEAVVDGVGDRSDGVGFVAAYGPTRVPAEAFVAEDLARAEHRPHLLFDDTALVPIERSMDDSADRDEMVVLLDALLPDDVRCLPVADGEGRHFSQRGLALPVGALSDGLQSFLAWVGDLLRRLDGVTDGRLVDVPGVVLVDEVDQRMHPQWQQSFVTRLGATFPALQFICTAHSPLLPSGLRRENLLLVEPDPDHAADGATLVQRLRIEDVYGRSADQVLESSYFGMASTRSEPFWEELREIAAHAQARTGGRAAALEFMRRLADPGLRREDGR